MIYIYMGVSENSVPLNPMVLLIIIPIKWLFHWEYTLFSDKPIYILYTYYSSCLVLFSFILLIDVFLCGSTEVSNATYERHKADTS